MKKMSVSASRAMVLGFDRGMSSGRFALPARKIESCLAYCLACPRDSYDI